VILEFIATISEEFIMDILKDFLWGLVFLIGFVVYVVVQVRDQDERARKERNAEIALRNRDREIEKLREENRRG
jgi:hypothetical protein